MTNIYLLTHPRELKKASNTGALLVDELPELCTVYPWHRKQPDQGLMDKISSEAVALLYPSSDAVDISQLESFDSYIILDATWQEARKIYNHSPYLKDLIHVKLDRKKPSIYTLRRNQKEKGLCTAECASEILKVNGWPGQAQQIDNRLIDFIGRARCKGGNNDN